MKPARFAGISFIHSRPNSLQIWRYTLKPHHYLLGDNIISLDESQEGMKCWDLHDHETAIMSPWFNSNTKRNESRGFCTLISQLKLGEKQQWLIFYPCSQTDTLPSSHILVVFSQLSIFYNLHFWKSILQLCISSLSLWSLLLAVDLACWIGTWQQPTLT